MVETFNIGVAGLGTVGTATIKLIEDNINEISEKSGKKIIIKAVSAKDNSKDRSINLKRYYWEKDASNLAKREDIDAVVELIGGSDGIAYDLIKNAIKNNKHVITANKAFVSAHGYEIINEIKNRKVGFYYEASVVAAIPIINSIKYGLISNNVIKIEAILNGTANYILSDMTMNDSSFNNSLLKAQELGYAEADPSFDVNGTDSAHKLSILGMLSFGIKPDISKIYIEGISNISIEDIKYANRLGYIIKLFCLADRKNNILDFRVHPALVSKEEIISKVNGALNAIFLKGNYSSKVTFIGEGAGADPTASSVVSDIINAAINHNDVSNLNIKFKKCSYKSIFDRYGAYYIRIKVKDLKGVLANITSIFNDFNISLDSVIQDSSKNNTFRYIVALSHMVKEIDMINAIKTISKLKTNIGKPQFIRVEKI